MKKASKKRQREPSKASLREMPEVDFSGARVRRNPYAKRIKAEGLVVQVGRGRPQKLLEVGGTVPRSVRFPPPSGHCSSDAPRPRGSLFTRLSGRPLSPGRVERRR